MEVYNAKLKEARNKYKNIFVRTKEKDFWEHDNVESRLNGYPAIPSKFKAASYYTLEDLLKVLKDLDVHIVVPNDMLFYTERYGCLCRQKRDNITEEYLYVLNKYKRFTLKRVSYLKVHIGSNKKYDKALREYKIFSENLVKKIMAEKKEGGTDNG